MIYLNGNCVVRKTGFWQIKRVKTANEEPALDFPESIDLKITNKCSYGCPYCHESSIPTGKSFDLDKTVEVLSQLPGSVPIEIAIGGGDVLDEPRTIELVNWLKSRKYLTRVTLNMKDIANRDVYKLLCAVDGFGVSIDSIPSKLKVVDNYLFSQGKDSLRATIMDAVYPPNLIRIETDPFDSLLRRQRRRKDGNGLLELPDSPTESMVIHIIAGIFPYDQLDRLLDITYDDIPILVLGYKQWGRAKDTALPQHFDKFREKIRGIVEDRLSRDTSRFLTRRVIGFDNLALEQLGIRDLLTQEQWDTIYLGDEGSCSMYIDAVEGKFARTSRSENRVSWDDVRLLDFFKSLRG